MKPSILFRQNARGDDRSRSQVLTADPVWEGETRVTVVLFEGILPRQHESQASNQAFCIDRMLVGASERGAKSYRWLSVRD